MGRVPTLSIDKTDGIQVYLNKDTLDLDIVSSKSSEMNIMIPKSDGDYVSKQNMTVINRHKIFKLNWDYKYTLYELHYTFNVEDIRVNM